MSTRGSDEVTKNMIRISRTIVRETAATERGRPLLIELHPGFLAIRLKGTRQRWPLSYISIFWHAVKAAAEKDRAERNERRKTRA
jgi:hypothetical protein